MSKETAAEGVVEVLQPLRSAPLQHFLNWEAYLFKAEAGHQSSKRKHKKKIHGCVLSESWYAFEMF